MTWQKIGETDTGGQVFVAPVGTPEPQRFVTKDSGKREERPSGYVRDTQSGKPRFDLLLPVGIPFHSQMLTRLAQLLARGADKYSERNWERANDDESLDRFKSSALRHLLQWMTGETDEDHAAAVMYNVLAHESTKWKMEHNEDPTSRHRDEPEPGTPVEPVRYGYDELGSADGVKSDDLLGSEVVSRPENYLCPHGWNRLYERCPDAACST